MTEPTTQAGQRIVDRYGWEDDTDDLIADVIAAEAEARAEGRAAGIRDAQGEANDWLNRQAATIAALTAPHKRSEPQDYDPTPACVYCHKAWDEGGNYLPEYRCPYSPAALADTAAAAKGNENG